MRRRVSSRRTRWWCSAAATWTATSPASANAIAKCSRKTCFTRALSAGTGRVAGTVHRKLTGRQHAEVALGLLGLRDDVGAGLVHRRVGAQQPQGLDEGGVVGEVGVEQLEQAYLGGVARPGGARPCHQHWQRRHALAQVGAGGLAGLVGLGGHVEDVVGELEGGADDLAVGGQCLLDLAGRAAEAGAVASGGGDQGAGLAGDHVEVVPQRVLVGAGRDGLEDLALDEPGEGLGLDAHRVGAQARGQLGGAGEEEVTGEDGDQVVPAGVGRVGAAAQVGLVHHVVVVERAHVGDLDDAGRREHLLAARLRAGLGGQQHQQRPEPLAAGRHQVCRGLGDVLRAALDVAGQQLLDGVETLLQARGHGLVGDGQCQVGQGRGRAHLMNCPASAARSSTGPGTTPSARVPTTPTTMTAVVSGDGVVTEATSPSGTAKYMTRIRRM